MKTTYRFTLLSACCLLFLSCEKSDMADLSTTYVANHHRLDIGLNDIIKDIDFTTVISPRSHGYVVSAKGNGVIPSGEYAGQRFQIDLDGNYLGLGNGTLVSGSALVKIRAERFISVMDPLLQSFCCGEGDLLLIDGEYIFTMFGQVNHSTAGESHHHLFAGLARTGGTMNMNIEDQTGTVVIPATPPHDPGIGLIEDFDAQRVRVNLH
jgi:hypothetical protein